MHSMASNAAEDTIVVGLFTPHHCSSKVRFNLVVLRWVNGTMDSHGTLCRERGVIQHLQRHLDFGVACVLPFPKIGTE